MARSGEERVQRISGELSCPDCDYSLQGLDGEVVVCPECGQPVNVAKLVVSQWTGPWQQAPGYGSLIWPVAWLLFGGLGAMVIVILGVERGAGRFAVPLAGALWLGVWGLALWRLRRRMSGGRAILLSLAAHGLLLGYTVGAGGVLVCLGRAIGTWPTPAVCAVWIIAAVPFAAVFWACRRGERMIATECIRQHLAHRARVGAPG